MKELDFGRMKATDMKGNKKIVLPKAMENDLEAMMEVRRMEAKKIFRECMKLLEEEKGVTEDNLTKEERLG